ncbi:MULTISPECIES: DUF6544 family protein [unclassified Methanosarcina]|uniref:DUF6544 family protein n=1 Tax=unclassified Methanosarcina TaxID=2644672 RepID=UPI000615A5DC|nr:MULTISPECIES: DUF6544 family protein [unclassified Methanosarcina]AKB19662.1 hypothetical protein MSWHS_2799 [Methanosarcina sp. WWM596]AKB22547.1 hypothetical protein MSWH1_2276 [Methanosarcina sp. WH1]
MLKVIASTIFFVALSKLRKEIEKIFTQHQEQKQVTVTEDMLHKLPDPVKKYLVYTGVVGKPIVQTVRLKQVGKIRKDTKQPWMNFEAKEYYSVSPPGFVWIAYMKFFGLPLMRVRDYYLEGKGNLLVKAVSLFTIANSVGKEMDQGAMMRYLNEMMWFPSAFLGKNVSFESIDANSARVTLKDIGKSVTATMYFDDEGKVTNFIAPRYRDMGNNIFEFENWSTPFREYGEFEGLKLPLKGAGVWNLKEGDLEYIDLTITDLKYDPDEPY